MAERDTEQEAIQKVRGSLKFLLSEAPIVQLEMENAPEEHPGKQFAGMFSLDTDGDAFQAAVRPYREEHDRALGAAKFDSMWSEVELARWKVEEQEPAVDPE